MSDEVKGNVVNLGKPKQPQEPVDHLAIEINQMIERLNKDYTHIVSGGRNFVITKTTDAFNNATLEFMSCDQFRQSLSHEDRINGKNIGEMWLNHKSASFNPNGVTFVPIQEPTVYGKVNSYMGLGVEPIECDESEIKLYLNHIKSVICGDDKEYYKYVINWLAHLMQKPEEKPEVAIFLRAGQGVGKGVFVRPLMRIIGAHYAQATDPNAMGKFNALTENKILFFADEFFSKSKDMMNKLKALITESTATIERKGVDTIIVPSYMRLILASNAPDALHIETDDRRYFWLEVSERYKQDTLYFNALVAEIDAPEFAGKLLYYLQSIDIGGFNPRQVPKTQALTNRKIEGLLGANKWLYDCLNRGYFLSRSHDGSEEMRLTSSEFETSYKSWHEEQVIGKHPDSLTPHKRGRLLKAIGLERREQKKQGREDRYYYELLPLEDMRQAFETQVIYGRIEWGN